MKHLRSMSRLRPPNLRLVSLGGRALSHIAADESEARRDASHWYVRLREEPDEEAVRTQFDEWLHADPVHAEAWISMCETMEAVQRAPPMLRCDPMPSQSRRYDGARHTSDTTGTRKLRAYVATAAVVAVCAVVLALPTVSLHLRADHITSAGNVERFRLADGSTVHLGPDSAVAIDYGGRERKVRLLEGQALFEVTRNPARPFRVAAGDVTTTVLGTSFDVRMIGDATSVAVKHGHVRVENRATEPRHSRDLRAGQWVRIDAGHAVESGVMAPELIGSWNDGEVLANNRAIASIIEEIRPWYRGRIIVADAAITRRPVTGIYSLHDPEQALSMIVKPYGGRIRRITPWLLIVSGS